MSPPRHVELRQHPDESVTHREPLTNEHNDRDAIRDGTDYQNLPVVTEGRIIPANGPDSALEFGQVIVQTLTGKRL